MDGKVLAMRPRSLAAPPSGRRLCFLGPRYERNGACRTVCGDDCSEPDSPRMSHLLHQDLRPDPRTADVRQWPAPTPSVSIYPAARVSAPHAPASWRGCLPPFVTPVALFVNAEPR